MVTVNVDKEEQNPTKPMCEKAILVCFDFSLRLKTDEGSVIDPTQQGLLALAPGLADKHKETTSGQKQ